MSVHPYAPNRELVYERLHRPMADAEPSHRDRSSRRSRSGRNVRVPAGLERGLAAVGGFLRIGPEPELPTF